MASWRTVGGVVGGPADDIWKNQMDFWSLEDVGGNIGFNHPNGKNIKNRQQKTSKDRKFESKEWILRAKHAKNLRFLSRW